MVNDHTSLQKQWLTMISNNGMKFKSGMGPKHRDKLERIEKLSGRQFDRVYMSIVAQNHREYLDYFRKEGRGANSAAVRERVNRAIPMLEQHFRQAKQIGGRVGADTTTVKDGRLSKYGGSSRD
jgi:putative membrane protein